MVRNLLILREIFKGDHNAAGKLRRKQISALSGTLNYENDFQGGSRSEMVKTFKNMIVAFNLFPRTPFDQKHRVTP